MSHGESLVTVDPVVSTILRTLSEGSASWVPFDDDEISETDRQAILLLARSGLVSLKRQYLYAMPGVDSALRLTFSCDGLINRESCSEEALKRSPPGWKNWRGRWRGRIDSKCVGAWFRLTTEGERAKQDASKGIVEPLLWHVFESSPHRKQPEPVLLDFEAVEHQEGGQNGTQVIAAAQATASVGDINVANQVNVDMAPVAEVLREVVAAKNGSHKKITPDEPREDADTAENLTETDHQILGAVDALGAAKSIIDILDQLSSEGVIASEGTLKPRLAQLKRQGTLVANNPTNNTGYKRPG